MARRSAAPAATAAKPSGGPRKLRDVLGKYQKTYGNSRPPGGIAAPVGTYPCCLKSVDAREAKDREGNDQLLVTLNYEITDGDHESEIIPQVFRSTEYGEGADKNSPGLGRLKEAASLFNAGEPIDALDEVITHLQECVGAICTVKVSEYKTNTGRTGKQAELLNVDYDADEEGEEEPETEN